MQRNLLMLPLTQIGQQPLSTTKKDDIMNKSHTSDEIRESLKMADGNYHDFDQMKEKNAKNNNFDFKMAQLKRATLSLHFKI